MGISGLGIFVSVPKLQNGDTVPWFYRNFESFKYGRVAQLKTQKCMSMTDRLLENA